MTDTGRLVYSCPQQVRMSGVERRKVTGETIGFTLGFLFTIMVCGILIILGMWVLFPPKFWHDKFHRNNHLDSCDHCMNEYLNSRKGKS